ncbi:MAG: M48 family peptidase [Proteobacteria bacterium]|nr:MAG: M48 family peptidase [Pseudomonadota bacterium]
MKFVYASIFTATCVLVSCVSSNQAGRTQLNLVSDEQMNADGEAAYKDILAKSKISQKTKLNSEVVNIGRKIAAASGVDYAWEFSVIDEDQVNAFCLPGGKVAVYTGIIPVAQNNAALAAVMGHEVAHAVLKHSAERASQQMVLGLGASVVGGYFGNDQTRDTIAAVMGIGVMYGVSLPFSRYHEAEADRIGLEYMAKAGYDPRESVTLWERMGAQSGGRSLEILSTHPDPANRAKALSKLLPKAMATYNASTKVATSALPSS